MTTEARSRAQLDVAFGADGLAPAIVQDATDGTVLMLGWMDAEAVAATLATNEVHFHSRSRDRLWRKGETSGNVLRVAGIAVDCDRDAILVVAEPAGPTCHRGTRSCFDDANVARSRARLEGFAWLESLWSTIAGRAASRPEGSYTARLLDGGVDAVARKVAEEATEVVIAAKDAAGSADSSVPDGARTALSNEVADLLYHTLVLLAERDLRPAEVLAVLRSRAGD
jgi:phosphoribosyl-AMP cyclohydrolase / phosphoribosyl-ATP pyrophosphohydrolase